MVEELLLLLLENICFLTHKLTSEVIHRNGGTMLIPALEAKFLCIEVDKQRIFRLVSRKKEQVLAANNLHKIQNLWNNELPEYDSTQSLR